MNHVLNHLGRVATASDGTNNFISLGSLKPAYILTRMCKFGDWNTHPHLFILRSLWGNKQAQHSFMDISEICKELLTPGRGNTHPDFLVALKIMCWTVPTTSTGWTTARLCRKVCSPDLAGLFPLFIFVLFLKTKNCNFL